MGCVDEMMRGNTMRWGVWGGRGKKGKKVEVLTTGVGGSMWALKLELWINTLYVRGRG